MKSERIFDNTEIAFSLKSDTKLERAYFLFKMISIEPLVKIGAAATNFAIKAHLPIEGLIRSIIFDHFCGGVYEESSYLLVKLMNDYKLDKNDSRVWIGQLYGMSDNISFNLADKGYNVAKYIPFGPL